MNPRKCPACGEIKHPDEFYGRDSYCKPCRKVKSSKWRRDNAKWASFLARLRKYGLTQAQYAHMSARAAGCCESCGDPFTEEPMIEHNHATGLVRGLVCRRCNYAIWVLEDPFLVESAQRFIEERSS